MLKLVCVLVISFSSPFSRLCQNGLDQAANQSCVAELDGGAVPPSGTEELLPETSEWSLKVEVEEEVSVNDLPDRPGGHGHLFR